jgi:hypothetical protein
MSDVRYIVVSGKSVSLSKTLVNTKLIKEKATTAEQPTVGVQKLFSPQRRKGLVRMASAGRAQRDAKGSRRGLFRRVRHIAVVAFSCPSKGIINCSLLPNNL